MAVYWLVVQLNFKLLYFRLIIIIINDNIYIENNYNLLLRPSVFLLALSYLMNSIPFIFYLFSVVSTVSIFITTVSIKYIIASLRDIRNLYIKCIYIVYMVIFSSSQLQAIEMNMKTLFYTTCGCATAMVNE